jgi:hypothetical protein
MKPAFKILSFIIASLVLLSVLTYAYINWGLAPRIPQPKNQSALQLNRIEADKNFYTIGNNWLRKNSVGIWEEYVEGEPFERGVIAGKLNREMLYTQEVAFVDQIHKLVPNNNYLSFLALFTRVFNRDLEKNFPEENKLEIYGESFSAPKEFDYILPAYDRMLNYHAAHDIGHALQNLALVGCTSFAAWNARTADSSMLIGRNLDFSLGDKFAEDKIVYFCKPDSGFKFAMVTWAGFIGCVSGMNDKGLTVTLNAAKSDVPSKATTPISILAREILQYASNIDEAFAIAKKRKTFVCETLMIGSAADNRTALIEKSVAKTILYNSDTNYIMCANHYQSDSFKTDKNNVENIATSASKYRFNRLNELMNRVPKFTPADVASILRNQQGLNDKNIGMGNEKALNQLLSHHAIIFQPQKLLMWVSANPYQLGEFVCYDLNKVFAIASGKNENSEISETAYVIPQDSFLLSADWKNYLNFKQMKQTIKDAIDGKKPLENEPAFITTFKQTNPEFWETYFYIAEYFRSQNNKQQAVRLYETALSKEVNDTHERDKMITAIKKLNGS